MVVIAVTGGPSGGKTSMLAHLGRELEDHGVEAVIVPEQARAFIGGGLNPIALDPEHFQEGIIRAIIAQEDIFKGLASRLSAKRVVVLCDRGAMDSRAYVDEQTFTGILAKNGWNVPMLRDVRYDAVLHLVTAADGAAEFYRTDNERFETAEEAVILDEKTRDAWVGHSHLHVIDNSTDFEGKKRRALHTVLHHLGLPIPLEIERKYKVSRKALAYLPKHAKPIDIEQYYLKYPDGSRERIRRRAEGNYPVYYLTVKRFIRPGVHEEIERQLTAEQYTHLASSEHVVSVMHKRRWCFVYKHQYFELDDLKPHGLKYCLLEIELTDEQEKFVLPSWPVEFRDVTEVKHYGNNRLARKLQQT